MQDIKHIRRDFPSATWVMPRGGTWSSMGSCGGPNFFFQKINQTWSVSYSQEWHMHWHIFFGPSPLGPWAGVKKFNFLNMVMWHFKLKGMTSRPGYTEKIILMTLEWGQRVNYHMISSRGWSFVMARH